MGHLRGALADKTFYRFLDFFKQFFFFVLHNCLINAVLS